MAFPRPAKRDAHETRDISITYEGLARADGSAQFSFGDTAALASVSGPIEVRLAAEHPSQATFEVNLRPLTNVPGTESRSLSATIRSALAPSIILTQNPRSLIQLSIQSLQPKSGKKDSLTATSINAGTAALLNAGIPMRGVVCAVSVGYSPNGVVVDPEVEEDAGGCFAFLFGAGFADGAECVWTSWRAGRGRFDEAALTEARGIAREAARGVYERFRESVYDMGARPGFMFDAGKVEREVEEARGKAVKEETQMEEEEHDDDDEMVI